MYYSWMNKMATASGMMPPNLRWTKSMNIRSFKTMGKPNLIPNRERYQMPQMDTRKSIFAVKHDGRHKVRLVPGGHLTSDPIESIYSGVVSIRSLRLVKFLAKMNNLEVWGADIGNAYLEAKTKEMLYVVAGPEFEELEGHILVIYKVLYGLKISGLRWSQKIHDIMLDMGFSPCKADPCVWLRKAKCSTKYEYVAIYVDDLLIACSCASEFIHTIKRKHILKIKGDGPLKYHLVRDYHLDPDGTLVALPKKYISKILDSSIRCSLVKAFPK